MDNTAKKVNARIDHAASAARNKTFAYVNRHKVVLAALTCPICYRGLHARDIEIIDDDSIRAICASCHVDLLSIERT